MTVCTRVTAIVLLIAFGLMVQALSNQSYLAVLGWLFTGLACAACTFGISCPWEKSHSMLFSGLATLAFLFSVAHIFWDGEFTKSGRQQAQFDLFSFFLEVAGGLYGPISQETSKLAEQGYRLCAIQRYIDISDAVLELQQAFYLGPGASLALGAYENWLVERPKEPTCLSTFIDFSYQAPELGMGFLRRNNNVEKHLPKR